MSLFFYLFNIAINLWHQKFVTAVLLHNHHGIRRRAQDFDKNFICNKYGKRLKIVNTKNILKIG